MVDEHILKYQENRWQFSSDMFQSLSQYEKSFLELELGTYKTLEFYQERLKAIGFNQLDTVLDAGCGIGQWGIALAHLNKQVEGVDLMQSRVDFAKHMSQSMKMDNLHFQQGELENLSFPDNHFDAVFCYGVFMFTDTIQTLKEFNRVLKPGGKLYVNFNSLGWYAHLIIDRGIKKKNYNMVRTAIKMVIRYFLGGKKQILIREHWLRRQLQKYGFDKIVSDLEGCISLNATPLTEKPKSIYQPYYYGMRSIIEILAEKQ